MTNRQFYGLMGMMMLNSAVLFKIIDVEPLMWGFGVMSIMMMIPVLAYGATRILMAAAAWLKTHRTPPDEPHDGETS